MVNVLQYQDAYYEGSLQDRVVGLSLLFAQPLRFSARGNYTRICERLGKPLESFRCY
jgi:hypothetical protein